MPYSGRHQHILGGSEKAMGGAGLNMNIEAMGGDTDMVTVFDDFNHFIENVEFTDTDGWEECGWVLTDIAAVGETVGMNDPADVSQMFESSIRIFTGTDDDCGGNMQLDCINADMVSTADELTTLSGRYNFPHLWIPETDAGVTILDNSVFTFACRVGMEGGAADGLWAAKYYIGMAAAGDTTVLTAAGGEMDIATEAGPHLGFHCHEDGSIDGISQRTATTAQVAGTNMTELFAAGSTDGTLANGAETAGDIMWFDLALRMTVTDMSDDDDNGRTDFYYRRVPPITTTVGDRTHLVGGQTPPWVHHNTVLTNQTMNHTVAMVPTIEAINSDDVGEDATLLIDWWAFGQSRYSRLPRAGHA